MCGRFALRTSVPELARMLGIEPPVPGLAPRYNIAPTQDVPIVGITSTVTKPMTVRGADGEEG